ncbi:Conserved_hypothetical protein [Hexamita inflata]|uniref:Uncharacterized protein n=1 Tax=Hexamita inflata TaxID=28002 RepID=A0ABP1HMN0_9EUKA
MIKAIIFKIVTRQLSSQISLNNKSSILVCTTSISDLNGSRWNSSVVTFQSVSGNAIYLSTISKSRKQLLSRFGVISFLWATVMIKAIIFKIVTRQLSSQISLNNKSSILVCTTSISDLNGSRWNSSVVTFQSVYGNAIYLSTISKSRKQLLSRIGVLSFLWATVMIKAIIFKIVTRQLSSQISLNNKSSILVCTTSISDLNESRRNSSVVTFQSVSGNAIYLSTISKSRKQLLSRFGVISFLWPTVMIKAIIFKIVTRQLSSQISLNNKSSILVCTTSISDLNGSRWNSSVVTFQSVSGNAIYISTISKSRKQLLSRIGVLSFLWPTVMIKAIIFKIVTRQLSSQISLNNKSSILVCTTSISDLNGSRWNSSVVTFQSVSGNAIYISTISKSRKQLLSRIGVLSFLWPTVMIKAIIFKIVTRQLSSQISLNNKSSILVCTTSISDLNGSRRNSSVVTFQSVSGNAIYISTISKSRKQLLSRIGVLSFLWATVMIKAIIFKIVTRQLSSQISLNNKSSILVCTTSISDLNGSRWNSSVVTFQSVSGNAIYLSTISKSRKQLLSRIGVLLFLWATVMIKAIIFKIVTRQLSSQISLNNKSSILVCTTSISDLNGSRWNSSVVTFQSVSGNAIYLSTISKSRKQLLSRIGVLLFLWPTVMIKAIIFKIVTRQLSSQISLNNKSSILVCTTSISDLNESRRNSSVVTFQSVSGNAIYISTISKSRKQLLSRIGVLLFLWATVMIKAIIFKIVTRQLSSQISLNNKSSILVCTTSISDLNGSRWNSSVVTFQSVYGNAIYISTISKSRKQLLSRIGVISFLWATVMIKAIIFKIVTRQLSSQISLNNKSSILVCTTSISDLNGSRRNSSVVTFQSVSGNAIYISTISKSRKQLLSRIGVLLFLWATVMIKAIIFKIVTRQLSSQISLNNKSSILVCTTSISDLNGSRWNSSVVTFQSVYGNAIYLSTISKSRKQLLSRIGVLSFLWPTVMIKAIIFKIVTRQLSSQISLNNKSSILVCTTSISDLNGSRWNSSVVTFQSVSGNAIYLSTISKSRKQLLSRFVFYPSYGLLS